MDTVSFMLIDFLARSQGFNFFSPFGEGGRTVFTMSGLDKDRIDNVFISRGSCFWVLPSSVNLVSPSLAFSF